MRDNPTERVVRVDVCDVTVDDSSSPEPMETSGVETIFLSVSADQRLLAVADHLPEHERLLDYLIERSLIAWTRSQG